LGEWWVVAECWTVKRQLADPFFGAEIPEPTTKTTLQ